MPSMIPSLSVCSSSITSSGVPVDATETTASVTGYAVCSDMILIFNVPLLFPFAILVILNYNLFII